MKLSRGLCVAAMGLALLAPAGAWADTMFSFNPLMPLLDGDANIGSYMSSLYGSQITVSGAAVGGLINLGFGTDSFLRTELCTGGKFTITFASAPIIGASFAGHVFDATPGADFRLRAYSGSELVTNFSRNYGVESFASGWLSFSKPVDRLVFSDSGVYDVGVDDLQVRAAGPAPAPVPAPGAAGLIALALPFIGWVKRRTA